jgi:hypothetical protein
MEMIAMLDNQPLFAALDVSLEKTTVCVMSLDGAITKEASLPLIPRLSRPVYRTISVVSNGSGWRQARCPNGWFAG